MQSAQPRFCVHHEALANRIPPLADLVNWKCFPLGPVRHETAADATVAAGLLRQSRIEERRTFLRQECAPDVIPGRSAGRANAVGVLQNQFGKFEIPTGTGYGLLVPTRAANDPSQ